MNTAEAIDLVCDIASRWGENMEEGFALRVNEKTTDEECLDVAHDSLLEAEEVLEVRNLWRAVDLLQQIKAQRGCEHFDKAVENGKLTSLIDIVVLG